ASLSADLCRPRPALHSFPTRRSSDLVVGAAGIDQRGDVRVVEAGEDLGLAAEAFAAAGAERGQGEDLDRGLLPGHALFAVRAMRSEEHTSELQSRENLVCRLLLEKKK